MNAGFAKAFAIAWWIALFFVPNAQAEENLWRQFPLFESRIPGERLFHVRVIPAGDVGIQELHAFFMGVIPPRQPGEDFTAVVYEKAPDRDLFVVDRFPAAVRRAPAVYGVGEKDGMHFDPYVWRQSDNFILKDRFLYYYIEPPRREDAVQYFKYRLESRKAPQPVGEAEFLADGTNYNIEDFQRVSLAPDGRSVAFTDTYDILYFRDPGDFQDLRRTRISGYDLPMSGGDFTMSSFFGTEDGEDFLLIGALSWSADGRFLYFDNSGIDYRCIWALDVQNRRVSKIVPEHGAVHPWSFEWQGTRCVAFTEAGTVRIAVEDASRIQP